MIDHDVILEKNSAVAYRRMKAGEGSLLLHLETTQYHGLDEAGSLVWDLLGDGVSLEGLLNDLRGHLDAVPDDFEAGVRALLEGLRQRDLIKVRAT